MGNTASISSWASGAQITARPGDDAEVDNPGGDPVANLGVASLEQDDLYCGESTAEGPDQGRKQLAGSRERAQEQPPPLESGGGGGLVDEPVDRAQRSVGVREQRPADVGQRAAGAIAHHKLEAEFGLQ